MQLFEYGSTIFYLLKSEFNIFLETIHDKFIDLFIWVIVTTFVTVYLLPAFGMQASYGPFTIASMAASAGLFEQFSSATQLIGDLEGDNITSYYLTLPMPSWMVFGAYMSFYAFNSAMLSIGVLPVVKLLFWHHFDLFQLHILKYGIMFLLTSLFYGAFTLWIVGKVDSLQRIGSVWMRFIYPLWFLGAFQYSYAALKDFNPYLAYASLINPMVYIMEGTRAAILGQQGYLNFWLCAGMTIFFTIICAADGIRMIKRRLDYV